MRNEFQRHKRGDKVKWAFTGIAFLLTFVMLAGVFMQLFASEKFKPSNWFTKTEQNEELPVETETETSNGAVIGESVNHGVRLASTKIEPMAYAENGISSQADTAYTLTATIEPADADNKSVDWSISWANANSEWASGKTVTDYVTITPTADGSLTANAVCKQAFGEPINISVTSRENEEATATCNVDYARRVVRGTLSYILSGAFSSTDSEIVTSTFGAFPSLTYEQTSPLFILTLNDTYTIMEDYTCNVELIQPEAYRTLLKNAGHNLSLTNSVANFTFSGTPSLNGGNYFYSAPTVTQTGGAGKITNIGMGKYIICGITSDYLVSSTTQQAALYNRYLPVVKANPNVVVMQAKFTISNNYETFEKTIDYRMSPDLLKTAVTGVSADSNLVF